MATWREFGPQRGPVGVRVAVDGAEGSRVLVNWSPLKDAAGSVLVGYEVQRRVGDGTFVDADPPHVVTETRYSDDAPPANVAHTYRVRAVTDAGATGWSAPASTAPAAPVLVAAPGRGSAVLSWTDPVDAGTSEIVGYQYQRKAEDAHEWDPPWADLPDGAAAARSHTVDGLADGMAYGFELRAVNASGPGAGSARAVVTPGVRPGAPRDLRATAADSRVTLSWKAPADSGDSAATGYEFRQSANGGADWMPEWTPVPGGNVIEYTVTGLVNAAAYVFEVRAVNEAGPGPASRVRVRTPPTSTGQIPVLAFAAHGDAVTLDLGRFFAVAPGSALSYEAWSLDPELVSVGVEDGRLVVVPNDDGEDGETTVRVRATDSEGRIVETVFSVTVEPVRSWWHRWGRNVVTESFNVDSERP